MPSERELTKLQYLWLDRSYLLSRKREAFIRWIAWHLPKSLVMWCYLRVGAHATTGKYGNTIVPELGMMEALDRWDSTNAT
jgi:inhibitor of KinA sporulation pathway (predicted exonuclease)